MRFEMLGPLRVLADGGEVSLRAGRERVLLAMLLLHADRAVPVDQLVEELWPGEQPRSARNQLQACVSRLRRRLAEAGLPDDLVITDAAGYRLRVEPERVDAYEFRALVADARAAGRPEDARDRFRAAAALWRGPALAGVDGPEIGRAAAALEEERVQSLQECLGVELALGRAGGLVGELTELVQRYPYREGLHAALMRALYGAGRSVDALAAFRRARQLLRDELGTDPGDELQRLHHAILNRDPALEPPRSVVAPSPTPSVVPRELPVEPTCFVGRVEEAAQVRSALLPADRDAGRRPPVVVLYGPGGVGKSALAIRVAHEVADEFPDGQLYVDLCGSTPALRPLTAIEVLGRFLRRLGAQPDQIPTGEADAAALLRSITADRRLLLVLDNAADKEQVAALIPGSSSCAVLITSRRSLRTVDADDRLRVDRLPSRDGLALFRGLTGGLEANVEAARAIVTLSGGLPLAIRIAAGRLVWRRDLPVTEYAKRLADRSRRLDQLQLDDLTVRACIRVGYDALLSDGGMEGQLAARAFRMLGLLHVPDSSPGVVAAMLAERDTEAVGSALDLLVDAQLVELTRSGRYRLHDLVRLVAAERADQEHTAAERSEAIGNGIGYYFTGLCGAEEWLRTGRPLPFDKPFIADGVRGLSFSGPTEARMWIDSEAASFVHIVDQAVATPSVPGRLLLWLGDLVWTNLDVRCEWQPAHRMSRLLLEVAGQRHDRELTAWAHLLYGRSDACLGNHTEAMAHLGQALSILRKLDNQLGVALTLNGIGIVHERCREALAALARYTEALEITQALGLVRLTVVVLNNMSVSYALLGQLDQAAAAVERGLSLGAAETNVASRTTAMINLASVQCLRGDCAAAVRCADEAVSLAEEAGDRLRQCHGLVVRSEARLGLGQLSDAVGDADRVLSLARAPDYRFAMAAAQRQRARILTAMGREAEAVRADALASDALAGAVGVSPDAMVELVLARAGSSNGGPLRARASVGMHQRSGIG